MAVTKYCTDEDIALVRAGTHPIPGEVIAALISEIRDLKHKSKNPVERHFPPGQPKGSNDTRCSIATWDLQVRFIVKAQAAEFVKRIIAEEIDYDVQMIKLDMQPEIFEVRIEEMSWANNLQRIASLLLEVDYHDVFSSGEYDD
jgi:hypothetical protein